MASYGLCLGPLEAEFGWSRAEASLGSSFALLFGGLLAPVLGKFIDARGPRFSIVTGAFLSCCGFLLLSTTSALWQWYLFNGLLSVAVQMMFFIPFMALVSRWFDARRGLALSLVDVGFLLGGFLMVPVLRFVIDSEGWRDGLLFSALLIALTTLPAGLLLVRDSPQRMGLKVDGGSGDRIARATNLPRGDDVPLSAAIRMLIFWLVALGFSFLFYGIVGWTVHQVPFWESHGYSRGGASLIVALAAGLGIVFGLVADRIRSYESAGAFFCLVLAASMLVVLAETNLVGAGIFILFWIVGSGGVLIEPLLIARSFGVANFATILGSIVFIETLIQIPSSPLAGIVFDSTGSYDWVLVMFSLSFFVAAALLGLASRLAKARQQGPASPASAG